MTLHQYSFDYIEKLYLENDLHLLTTEEVVENKYHIIKALIDNFPASVSYEEDIDENIYCEDLLSEIDLTDLTKLDIEEIEMSIQDGSIYEDNFLLKLQIIEKTRQKIYLEQKEENKLINNLK